jgi:hypothetical protein
MSEKEARLLFPTLVGRTVQICTHEGSGYYFQVKVSGFTPVYLIGDTSIIHSNRRIASTMTHIRSIHKIKIVV